MTSTSTVSGVEAMSKGARTFTLLAMVFTTSVMFIDMTIVTIAAPDIEKELGISDDALQWVINGYLLGLAATFAFFGRIADIVGHKRMAIIGTSVFVIASALCGFTPTGEFASAWIIGFRIIQGMGAAMLFPAALAIVVATFPLRERGRALAIFFAVTGGFTAIGPIAGGYLTEWTWRAIFWVNVPIGIIAIILTAFCHPSIAPKKEKIDWRGAILIIVGMGLSVLGIQQASQWGWASVWTIASIVLGIIILVIFVRLEAHLESPIMKVRIFKDRAFVADNAVIFFSMMTFVAVFFYLSIYAQVVLGQTSQNAGFFLMWFFIGFVIAAQVGGAMLDAVGSKLPMMLGTIIGAIGYAVWAYQSTKMTSGAIVPWIVVAGAGMGLILGPASTDAVNRAINASYGEVTGITQTIRNYGSALGVAILGTIMLNQLNDKIVNSLVGFGLSEQQAETFSKSASSMHSGGSGGTTDNVPEGVREQVFAAIKLDFAESIQFIIYGMAIMMVVAFISALFHPGGKVELPAEGEMETDKAEERNTVVAVIRKLVVFALIFAAVYAFFSFIG